MSLNKRMGRALEKMNLMTSKCGVGPIFDLDLFPWICNVEGRLEDVSSELKGVLENIDRIPRFDELSRKQERLNADQKWRTFVFSIFGHWIQQNCESCPKTAEVLRIIPGVQNSMFSILAPGKYIPPHRGPYNGLLRYHLGLIVPRSGQCWIRIADQTVTWAEGRSLVFDDTFEHEVHNDTSETRVVLFADFLRPLGFPASIVNKQLVRHIGRPYIEEGLKRLSDFDAFDK
jgi:aspartyl/asparaginyl beta-hydroxylase (cupin superfamily)